MSSPWKLLLHEKLTSLQPTAIIASVLRSKRSIDTYGPNRSVLLRPDAAIVVIQTANGYLITYSLATDPEARTYQLVFIDSHKRHARKRSVSALTGQGNKDKGFLLDAPSSVHEASLRFRMVIKLDAGISQALALDDELVIGTSDPPSIQCIRWTPNTRGSQTGTQMLSRLPWLRTQSPLESIVYDRPMSLYVWVMGDGSAYAAQRTQGLSKDAEGQAPMFKGHGYHFPPSDSQNATTAAINSRFSLIATGLHDGSIWLYSVRDYEGAIVLFRKLQLPVSSVTSGQITTLRYSPDGHCLFVGYEHGWATWTVYGQAGGSSFSGDRNISASKEEDWLMTVRDAIWIGGGSDIIIFPPSSNHFSILEFARAAVAGLFSPANISKALLQTSSGVMLYQGHDMPDLTTISSDISLWHQIQVPSQYLSTQWPLRCSVISADGRYLAVAGQHGLAHYSVQSGRWKTFENVATQNSFVVRGGMCWHQHVLIAAVETSTMTHELRLYSREKNLDDSSILHVVSLTAPAIHIGPSGDDSILVYTMENVLDHYIVVAERKSVRLVKVGQIGLHGIIRAPARVRAVSWIVPDHQLQTGDPSQDVSVATVFFLIDGKLVLLQPTMTDDGELKYDMRFIANNVEYYLLARDGLTSMASAAPPTDLALDGALSSNEDTLRDSLWLFDGSDMRVYPDVADLLTSITMPDYPSLPPSIAIPVDFFPLSVLVPRGILIGAEAELLQQRTPGFSYFRTIARTTLFIPPILRAHLAHFNSPAALHLSGRYQQLPYFAHALEILLHDVLDDEADAPPAAETALLPGVLSFLSSFPAYLEIIVQCTRKTEVRSWKTLFAHLPPARALFETSLRDGSLKTAAGYLLVLHTLEEIDAGSPQVVRVLRRAQEEGDWELCKELARFLMALDGTGEVLREALRKVAQRPGAEEEEGGWRGGARGAANGGSSDGRPGLGMSRLSLVTNGDALGIVGAADAEGAQE